MRIYHIKIDFIKLMVYKVKIKLEGTDSNDAKLFASLRCYKTTLRFRLKVALLFFFFFCGDCNKFFKSIIIVFN